MTQFILCSVVIGIGATLVYDLWGYVLRTAFDLPGSNWAMAGRWFMHMTQGQFVHVNIRDAAPMPYETAVGWTMHYLVGIVYAGALLAIFGMGWAQSPRFMPALIVGLVTITAGWLVMAPAMGAGIASANAANVTVVRAVQLAGHAMFGVGLYLFGLIVSSIFSALNQS
ncbi:DUF2938 domain-containing protein [Achromobacter xylosoxidans]